jgi:hypothetical protein
LQFWEIGFGYRWGRAARVVETVTGPEAREHIDQLSQKYHGQDYAPDDIKSERVMVWRSGTIQSITNQSEQGV